MKEYKIEGLSCASCAADMEEKIQKLDHGETAAILYNSSKLKIDEEANLSKVKKILASDGAAIVSDEEQEHGHVHTHAHNNKLKLFLGISTGLFLLTIIFEAFLPNILSVLFYLTAITISGYQTFIKGLKNLFRLKFNIDTLMTIALVGAISIGEWKEATLVAILFGLNEYLEGLGMEKARKSMEKLLKVAPKEATLIHDGKEKVVPIDALQKDDIVLVKSGEKIPSDGIVVDGVSSVNEAAITGESLPVEKEVNAKVFGGSINNEGVLKIRITKAFEDSSLAKILHLVQEAQETKTPTEQFINKFAKYYTPFIMIISLLVMTVPPLLFGAVWGTWFYQGLAVLIVGCPCALILSSPIAIVSGITRNARNGILVKGGVFLEQLGKINTIAFDKTGTLTKGEPHVEKIVEYDNNLLTIAGAVEKKSSHPLAKAIMKKVDEAEVHIKESDEIKTLSGRGIEAMVDGNKYYVGNEISIEHLNFDEKVLKDIEEMKAHGLTLVIVADVEHVLGIFGISDEIRQESKEVMNKLHLSGIKHTVMLTGDHAQTAEIVANEVGVSEYHANLLPEQKVEKIKTLHERGNIAMIGDGINDAPALAVADLGIAMGKGTDSAIETADIVLMQDHLGKLPSAVAISKRVNQIIKLNISLALGLKLIALLLTIPGWLTLWIAILSDMGATILVSLISLTIMIDKK
ncbi:heavy metal translocating P-type ATPase [Chengkuizengella axinellae]|uniref:Cd(2+)-exporting ATPase n=1 Tax=Chengkuizengella axinellae TaxID=3064388 RepID=A0ABT9J0N1_9BACL|nr:heavy metal translocating P-type ATPase [Chengkuizengella sp. 2205SS18-9]MDP5275038.1 heavy metal translocating P-type ATPase [Chengkuizengella sp. 2205SS18-9]